MKIVNECITSLRCPKCMCQLREEINSLTCLNPDCNKVFPIIDSIPILIDEEKSVFSNRDFIERRDTTINTQRSIILKLVASSIPRISNNIKAKKNYLKFTKHLLTNTPTPKVLIIGSGTKGQGMDPLITNPNIDLYVSDVSFGPETRIILDAHNIPFENNYFDGIVVQAVLEHVVDPFQCVQEIHRVLKQEGFVYAETPFMQQVHEGKYDFHRFTHLGHRRLFRNFSEIDSGAVCGPGMALAWAYSYFIYSFFKSKKMRKILLPITHFSSFFLKYLDYFLINKPGAYDAASGYFFMGQKSNTILKDRELLKLYKGLL